MLGICVPAAVKRPDARPARRYAGMSMRKHDKTVVRAVSFVL